MSPGTAVMNLVVAGIAIAYLWVTRSSKKTTQKDNTPSSPSPPGD